jgi:hypothetical protein
MKNVSYLKKHIYTLHRRKVLMRGDEWLICLKGFKYARLGQNSLGPRIWSRDKSALLLFAYSIL